MLKLKKMTICLVVMFMVVTGSLHASSDGDLGSLASYLSSSDQETCIKTIAKLRGSLASLVRDVNSGQAANYGSIEAIYRIMSFKKCREALIAAFFGIGSAPHQPCPTCKQCDACPEPVKCPPVPAVLKGAVNLSRRDALGIKLLASKALDFTPGLIAQLDSPASANHLCTVTVYEGS